MTRAGRPESRATVRGRELADLLRAEGDVLGQHLWSCARNREEKSRLQCEGWTTTWGGRCGRLACPSCRRRLINHERSEAAKLFQTTSNSDCSLVTIMIARLADLDDAHEVVRRFRERLRGARTRMARSDGVWSRMMIAGYVEIDACETHRLVERPADVRDVTMALPKIGDGPVTWVPHVHLAVHHPGVDRVNLLETLSHVWPGGGRVDVRPFHSDKVPAENAARVAGYSLKHLEETEFSKKPLVINGKVRDVIVTEQWLPHIRLLYWRWMEDVRDGARLLRVRVDPVGDQVVRGRSVRVSKVPYIEAPVVVI